MLSTMRMGSVWFPTEFYTAGADAARKRPETSRLRILDKTAGEGYYPGSGLECIAWSWNCRVITAPASKSVAE